MYYGSQTKQVASWAKYFFVHIVESPSADDLLSGRGEGWLLMEALRLAGIPAMHLLSTNEKTFREALGVYLFNAMESTKAYPIIHISAHGNKDGIGLNDGRLIDWQRLRDILIPINDVLQGGLILCLSSCSGFSGCRMAMTESGSLPFFGMVSNTGEPHWTETAVAFVTFYHLLFKGKIIPDAVKAMCVASDNHGFTQIQGAEARRIWVDAVKKTRQQEMIRRLGELLRKNPPSDRAPTQP